MSKKKTIKKKVSKDRPLRWVSFRIECLACGNNISFIRAKERYYTNIKCSCGNIQHFKVLNIAEIKD